MAAAHFTPVHSGVPRAATSFTGGFSFIAMAVQSEDPGSTSEESQSREDTAMIQNDVLLRRRNLIQLLTSTSVENHSTVSFTVAIFRLGLIFEVKSSHQEAHLIKHLASASTLEQ